MTESYPLHPEHATTVLKRQRLPAGFLDQFTCSHDDRGVELRDAERREEAAQRALAWAKQLDAAAIAETAGVTDESSYDMVAEIIKNTLHTDAEVAVTFFDRVDKAKSTYALVGDRYFLKISVYASNSLEQEHRNTELLHQLGVPTLATELYQLENNLTILAIEQCSPETGEFGPNDPEDIANYNPRSGQLVAHALAQGIGKPLPANDLPPADWRGSRELFLGHDGWGREIKSLIRPSEEIASMMDAVADGPNGQLFHEYFADLLKAAKQSIGQKLAEESSGKQYAFIDDVRLSNFFFDDYQEVAIPTDLEFVSAADSALLATIADLGTFFARCARNQELQTEFLQGLWQGGNLGSQGEAKELLKLAAVFGTAFEAQFYWGDNLLHPNHHSRPGSKETLTALLANLPKHLEFIEHL